jgi:lipoprotein-releasing system permease protein
MGMTNWPIELEIAWRYTSARRKAGKNKETGSKDGFLSFISSVSMVGIALGVAALIVVLSVMNGFQKEVRDRMLSVLSHIEIQSPAGLGDWPPLVAQVRAHPHVIGAAPMVMSQALISRGDVMRGVAIRGIDPVMESTVSDIPKHFIQGSIAQLRPGEFGLALGAELAMALGVQLGDRITIMVPEGDINPAGMTPRMRAFKLVGVIDSGHYEFDSTLAVIHWKDAAALLRLDGPSGLRLKLDDMQIASKVGDELAVKLPGLWVKDWSRQNKNWFAAVQTEKRMMFIILTLIIAVAAFNLVSTLVMTVTDKQGDIAILRTMGASAGMIQRIFFAQGFMIGALGTLGGVLLGLLIALNIDVIVPVIEAIFRVQFIPRDIYFISSLPSDVRSSDVVTVGLMAFSLSLIATLYPSWRAAKVQPANALRYE